jgi:hypothetical protein
MTDLLLTENSRPLRCLTPRVTGVPTDQCGLRLRPSPKPSQDARFHLSPRRVQKKRLGLLVVNSSRARMKAQGVSLAHSEAEATWAHRQVHLIPPQTVIGGADHDQVFHHAAAHLVSLVSLPVWDSHLLEGVASSSTPPTPQLTRRKLELLPRSGTTSTTPSPLASPKMGQSSPASRPSPFGAAKFVSLPTLTRFSRADV